MCPRRRRDEFSEELFLIAFVQIFSAISEAIFFVAVDHFASPMQRHPS